MHAGQTRSLSTSQHSRKRICSLQFFDASGSNSAHLQAALEHCLEAVIPSYSVCMWKTVPGRLISGLSYIGRQIDDHPRHRSLSCCLLVPMSCSLSSRIVLADPGTVLKQSLTCHLHESRPQVRICILCLPLSLFPRARKNISRLDESATTLPRPASSKHHSFVPVHGRRMAHERPDVTVTLHGVSHGKAKKLSAVRNASHKAWTNEVGCMIDKTS
jgi:hypothetical protein